MKHNHCFCLSVLAVAAVVSCCPNRNQPFEQTDSVTAEIAEDLSKSARTALDSLSALLVDEYRKYDLPHFNPGVGSMHDGYVAMWYPTKEESVNYSFGILFCCMGVKSTIAVMRSGNEEILAQREAEFKHPLPCTFNEYFKRETPTWELFEKYYEKCVEAGEVKYFWKFQYAFHVDAEYLVSFKPKNVLKRATDAQYLSFVRKCMICREAVEVLSAEDSQFASLLEFRKNQAEKYGFDENRPMPNVNSAVKGYPEHYDFYQTIRHNLMTR